MAGTANTDDKNKNSAANNGNEGQQQNNANDNGGGSGTAAHQGEQLGDNKPGASGTTPPENNSGNAGNNNSGSGNEKTFTQEEINRMMAKEKNQGRNAAYNELGLTPEEAKKAAERFKEELNKNKTPDQIVNEELEKERAKAAKLEAQLEAVKFGVKPEFAQDVVLLATVKMHEEGTKDINAALAEIAVKFPSMFGSTTDENASSGKKGTGSNMGAKTPNGAKNDNGENLGKRLATQAAPPKAAAAKRYWGNGR